MNATNQGVAVQDVQAKIQAPRRVGSAGAPFEPAAATCATATPEYAPGPVCWS